MNTEQMTYMANLLLTSEQESRYHEWCRRYLAGETTQDEDDEIVYQWYLDNQEEVEE